MNLERGGGGGCWLKVVSNYEPGLHLPGFITGLLSVLTSSGGLNIKEFYTVCEALDF
jgi:hypothetical protein